MVRAGVDAICGLSLSLVLSFAPVSPSPQKPTFPNSNLTRNQEDVVPLCGSPTSNSLFIYLMANSWGGGGGGYLG